MNQGFNRTSPSKERRQNAGSELWAGLWIGQLSRIRPTLTSVGAPATLIGASYA